MGLNLEFRSDIYFLPPFFPCVVVLCDAILPFSLFFPFFFYGSPPFPTEGTIWADFSSDFLVKMPFSYDWRGGGGTLPCPVSLCFLSFLTSRFFLSFLFSRGSRVGSGRLFPVVYPTLPKRLSVPAQSFSPPVCA